MIHQPLQVTHREMNWQGEFSWKFKEDCLDSWTERSQTIFHLEIRFMMSLKMMWSMMFMKTGIRMTTRKKDRSQRIFMRIMIITITSPSSLPLNLLQQRQQLQQLQQRQQGQRHQQPLQPQRLHQQDQLWGLSSHSTRLLYQDSGGRNQHPFIKFPNLLKQDTTLTRISTPPRLVLKLNRNNVAFHYVFYDTIYLHPSIRSITMIIPCSYWAVQRMFKVPCASYWTIRCSWLKLFEESHKDLRRMIVLSNRLLRSQTLRLMRTAESPLLPVRCLWPQPPGQPPAQLTPSHRTPRTV